MHNQEAFDRVWQHFVVEKNLPGWDPLDLKCRYITRDGNRCAIGCLLSKEDASYLEHDLGGPSITTLVKRGQRPEALAGVDVLLLRDLQAVHDWSVSSGQIEGNLRRVAGTHSLEVPS